MHRVEALLATGSKRGGGAERMLTMSDDQGVAEVLVAGEEERVELDKDDSASIGKQVILCGMVMILERHDDDSREACRGYARGSCEQAVS